MADKTDVIRYAAEDADTRDALTAAERNDLLTSAYPGGETLSALGRSLLRAAEMRWLADQPLQQPDRLGRYAALYLEDRPEGSVVLCLLDRKYRLLETHLLASGPSALLADYAPRIPALFRKAGAAYAVIFLAPRAAQYGCTAEDERLASRVALYCKQQHVPLIECIVARLNEYRALFREYDYPI